MDYEELSELPEWLRDRILEHLTRPAMDAVQDLLQTFVEDACSLDEVRQLMRSVARGQPMFLPLQLEALESILAEPQPEGTLRWLVEVDCNWGIDDDPTDRGAAVVLRQIADILRDAIEEAEAARR
ncbi:hypothetical protein FHR83_008702 [Actinoplanes campanulatus]|uniref:Uncharacterized protein n=1 Tax=Actinoplanes campanulatus TaxID=113559 RepID=A0A7W5FJX5_9ACTN|nr:hypothetical protein [Actinoplanes campanulatus]MBB3100975.1 hypothetical protein [Actinoplanes campanulatus]GGN49065.1 hypothetical protein GCM10010109_86680 [Actinoplanes campanulatus]GID41793.1 hypothetical protein Aca09nite_82990 [Actinoplanes campanulatus]